MHPIIVLDVDGTITTAECSVRKELRDYASEHGVPMYINTARASSWCAHPDEDMTSMVPDRTKHHCMVGTHPVASKVHNMNLIAPTPTRCAVLVDDRPENVAGVEAAGYRGILVDAAHGITQTTLRQIREVVEECQSPPIPAACTP